MLTYVHFVIIKSVSFAGLALWRALFSQPVQIFIKIRIRNFYTLSTGDGKRSITEKSCNGKGHSHTVIQIGVNDSAVQRLAAVNDHAVLCGNDIGPHFGKIFCHYQNAVGFVYL